MVKLQVAEEYLESGLRILKLSPPIPSVPWVVGTHVSKEKQRTISAAMLGISAKIQSGELVTTDWDSEIAYGFGPGNDSYFDYTRELLTELMK